MLRVNGHYIIHKILKCNIANLRDDVISKRTFWWKPWKYTGKLTFELQKPTSDWYFENCYMIIHTRKLFYDDKETRKNIYHKIKKSVEPFVLFAPLLYRYN